MYQEESLRVLNRKWREIIFSLPIVDNIHEFLLLKYVLTNQDEFEEIKGYPFVFAYEFPKNPERSQDGKMDLILANIENDIVNFKIVEFKYLPIGTGATTRTSRRKKRREVEEQTDKYTKHFQSLFKESQVTGVFFTNEDDLIKLNKKYISFLLTETEKINKLYPFLEFSPM